MPPMFGSIIKYIKANPNARGKNRLRSIEAAKRRVKDGELYFITRHGGWFRPGAHGYTNHIGDAGLFDGTTARGYLDVEGLAVVPLKTAKRVIEAQIGDHERVLAGLRDHLARIST